MFDQVDSHLLAWQLVFALILYLATFVSRLLSNLFQYNFRKFKFSSCYNQITSGVLLGICFLDLLPKAQINFVNHQRTISLFTEEQAAYIIVVVGFLLVLTLETIIIMLMRKLSTPLRHVYLHSSEKVNVIF